MSEKQANSTDGHYYWQYLTTAVAILVVVWYAVKPRRKNLPPGPPRLPLVGNLFQVTNAPHVKFMQWAKLYGPMIYLNLGPQELLVLSDPTVIREFYGHWESAGRNLNNALIYEYTQGKGIATNEGEALENLRRFTLRTLRDFGFAKHNMEGMILEDVALLLDWFKKREGTLIPGNEIFSAPVLNTIWKIVAGQKSDWRNGISEHVESAVEFAKVFSLVSSNGLYYAPFLRFIAPEKMGWNRYVHGIRGLASVCEKFVEEHKENLDNDDNRDYIDRFLQEIENVRDPNSCFYKTTGEKNLVGSLMDLLLAGSETTSSTLSWALLYLSHHQNIQKKVQEEIDKVIGTSRPPALSDRPQMPYVEAVLNEVFRVSSVIPLGLPHRIMRDFSFHGYSLAKNTIVLANIYGVHHDPEIWGDPEKFRPERFLSEDGSKIVKHEALIPFSEGKRKCLGDTVAKDSFFLYFVSIFQQFHVLPDTDKSDTGSEPNFVPEETGFVLAPKPYKIMLRSRM